MQKAYEFDFVYDTQAAFRLLLEALSNPGRIVELGPLARKLGGAYAMPLTVAAVLLDNEVSFAVCGSPALAEKITELTLAKTAAVSKADYIFVTENADWQEAVQAAKCGTLRDPHKSATVILCTADLQAGKLQRISGPGIKAVQEIIMCPELQAALGKRDEQEIEMGDRLYNRASDLSGGQKQRVGIARAIMQEPKLLLCDEPIASLDPNASKIIMDLIYQMTQRRNIACIVNLHQLDVAMRYATRIIGLAKGEMIFDGTPQQLNNAVIEKIYNTSMENLIIKQGENYA